MQMAGSEFGVDNANPSTFQTGVAGVYMNAFSVHFWPFNTDWGLKVADHLHPFLANPLMAPLSHDCNPTKQH